MAHSHRAHIKLGLFANTVVENKYLTKLQTNLIRSHCAGVGRPISRDQTRRLLALRTNVLAKGYSGVRPETLQQMVDAFNADCMPVVPSQGTVGASGDLAPLSHLALGLMGEGQMHNPRTGEVEDAAHVLREHGLRPIILEAKEGLVSRRFLYKKALKCFIHMSLFALAY